MYEDYYGLAERPFAPAPDPRFLYWSQSHQAAVAALECGFILQQPFVLMTGEVGCGKTLVIEEMLDRVADTCTARLVVTTGMTPLPVRQWVPACFGPTDGDDHDLGHFASLLQKNQSGGRRSVLVVDEAQNLTDGALEELRLVSNLNRRGKTLLQIILVGQNSLEQRSREPALRALAQRISIHCRVMPLDEMGTWRYIAHRLEVAGAVREIFDDGACSAVHRHTGGVPRLINTLCDRTLVHGFAADKARVSGDDVGIAGREVGILGHADPESA